MNKTSAERLRQLMLTPARQEQGRCPTWRERPETRGTPAPRWRAGRRGDALTQNGMLLQPGQESHDCRSGLPYSHQRRGF